MSGMISFGTIQGSSVSDTRAITSRIEGLWNSGDQASALELIKFASMVIGVDSALNALLNLSIQRGLDVDPRLIVQTRQIAWENLKARYGVDDDTLCEVLTRQDEDASSDSID